MSKGLSRRNFLQAGAVTAFGAAASLGFAGCSASGSAEEASSAEISDYDAQGLPNPAYDTVTAYESGDLEISEHIACDVVVMGSGSAGCLAAISAIENGAENVVLVEKSSALGGNTRGAGSVFTLNCQAQLDAGLESRELEEYLLEAQTWHEYNFDRVMFKKFLENTGTNIDWIMGMGVPMDIAPNLDWLAAYNVGDQCMGYTGDAFSGENAINVYAEIMPEMGIDVRTSCPAVQIAMDGDVVAGLICKQDDSYIQFDSPSVVIASGAYGANNKLIRELTGRDVNRIQYCGIPDATGDGFYMAQAVGGYSTGVTTLGSMTARVKDEQLASDVNIIGAMQPQQVWLNQEGVRFTPEFAWYPQLFNALFQQFRTYSVIDSKVLALSADSGKFFMGFADHVPNGTECPDLMANLEEAVADENRPWIVKADTVEELAELLGIDDPVQAGQTVADYNVMIEQTGEDTEMGKLTDYVMTLDTPPYYGFRLNGNLVNARGGIRADINMRVMNQEGYPIKGLYAAGLDLEGFESQTYDFALTGSEQAIAIFSGRIAGESAANQI